MYTDNFKKEVRRIKAIKKRMSKVKIGLPKKVVFEYSRGIVTCFPKERKWVVEPKGMKVITLRLREGDRMDVTKFKARKFLKLAILKLLRNDS